MPGRFAAWRRVCFAGAMLGACAGPSAHDAPPGPPLAAGTATEELTAWQSLTTRSLAEVTDVRQTTAPLPYPPEVTAEVLRTLDALVAELRAGRGGARSGRALRQLLTMGYPAVLFLVNRLREVDYRDRDDLVWANQLNLTLTELTLGVNTGFVPVEAGDEPRIVDPRIAQWDAMTVAKWIAGVQSQWPTQASWDDDIARRRQRQDAARDEAEELAHWKVIGCVRPAPPPRENWERLSTKSLDQVLDVPHTTPPLAWPVDIDAAERARAEARMTAAREGSGDARAGALRELEAMGYAGLCAMIDELGRIDYRTEAGLRWAARINERLRSLAVGVHADFVPIESGPVQGTVDPRLAQWDARTVDAWRRGMETLWPSRAKWDADIAQRQAKRRAKLEASNRKDKGD